VLVLKSASVQETNNRHYVTCRLDAFIQIEHVGVELLARTFQPLVNKSADYNFTETAGFVSSVSRTAELNSKGVTRLAVRLTSVPAETRDQFVQITDQIAKTAAVRRAAGANLTSAQSTGSQRR
jgi:hypothetical protein